MNALLVLHPHYPLSPHQPSQTRTIPRKSPTPLPPLSKGGGLTARHKLSLCCIFTCDTSAFFIHQTFCRQDGGIALRPPTSPSPQPSQKHIHRLASHHPFHNLTSHFPVIHRPTFISFLYTLDNFRR